MRRPAPPIRLRAHGGARAQRAPSVAASGGGFDEDALDGEHKGVSLTEAHRALFAGWEWRDETRMQLELLSAFEREGMTGARLGFFERICCCCF